MNLDFLMRRIVSASIWQLARRAPTAWLVLIVAMALAYSVAHSEEFRVFENQSGQTFIQGSQGYRAQTFTTPSGNVFGSDNLGNTFQQFHVGPAQPVPPVNMFGTPQQ